MKKWWFRRIIMGIVMAVIAVTVLSFIVMQLWNILIPDLFKGPSITFWQSVGLLLLSHILLRAWGPWGARHRWGRNRWRERFEEKLSSMTPEEREKFKESWRYGCGPYRHEPERSKEQGSE